MDVFIAGYKRTPFGKLAGSLGSLSATQLGAHALSAALLDAGIAGDQVDYVFGGQAVQANSGQNPARQSALGAGLSLTIPAQTINSVCLSGIDAVVAAYRLIASGEASVVAVVGQESMTQAPHLVPALRSGVKFGGSSVVDSLENDGLTDAVHRVSMGELTERGNSALGISREEQDAIAVRSHLAAAAAIDFVQGEIAPVAIKVRGVDQQISQDEGIRPDTSLEGLSKLRSSFGSNGTITAGNASPLTDGAAALILVSEVFAAEQKLKTKAKILAHAQVAGPDTSLHAQPANAIRAALSKANLNSAQLQAIEINEAFASVVAVSVPLLGVSQAIVNANGGAIALGHPLGASGARIVGHLARRLQAGSAGSIGAAGICGGGGQGTAIILESV